ncbi:MAG: L,D-transpeptidase [Zetaproteobacteria bacterium]|nr:MAG: L,D-transpeptidase [Zetaproteobacteria bacterium]
MIEVLLSGQLLIHHWCGVRHRYPVSTAAAGAGNRRGSGQTPLGRHRIYARIGAGMPAGTIFRGRRPVGIFDPTRHDPRADWILSRILWLEGEETGVNRRGAVDTRARFIYIHGTADEAAIGTACSHGCIRMRNADIIRLFDRCRLGERVVIRR